MKEVKFLKTKTAIFIIILVVIVFMYAVLSYIEENYQKEYAEIPELSVYYKGTELTKMLPLSYKWTYKGEAKEESLVKEAESKKQGEFTITEPYKPFAEYEFSDKNTIFISNKSTSDYVMKMNERHKITEHNYALYSISNTEGMRANRSYSGGREWDDSKAFLKGFRLNDSYTFDVGEFVYVETINYLKQGEVTYAMKVVIFNEDDARVAKDYLNMSLEDTAKIEELAKKINFETLFNSARIDGKNLILEYNWHIQYDCLRMNNLIWFACIPDLETITYAPTHKKTSMYDKETGELVKDEVQQVVFAREEVDTESLANVENLKKFMEQI